MIKKTLSITIFVLIILALNVLAVTKLEAINHLDNAEQAVIDLEKIDLTTYYVSDALEKAKQSFDQKEYELTKSISEDIINTKNKAILMNSIILSAEQRMLNLSSFTNELQTNKLERIKNAFEKNDYINTQNLLTELNQELDEIESKPVLARFISNKSVKEKIWESFKKGAFKVGIILIVLIILGFFGFIIGSKYYLIMKIESLKKEKESLHGLTIQLQKDYFQEQKISKIDYKRAIEGYQERTSQIEEELPLLEETLKNRKQNIIFRIV